MAGFWRTIFRVGRSQGGDTVSDGLQNPRIQRRGSVPVDFDAAMSISAFWACARLLTEVVAAMPLKCYEIDPETNIKVPKTEYDLFTLLRYKPNARMTTTEFLEFLMLSLVTHGNFYAAVQRTARGQILDITPLVASQMNVRLQDGILYYEYTESDSSTKVFAEKSIWHLRLFGNGVVGLSPLQYAARAVGIAVAADDRIDKLAASGGKATGILTIDSALTDKQRAAVKENFKNMETGDADELFVLEAGFKYQQTSISPSDMQLIENRRFQVEDIARFMGVPSVLINDTSASTTWGSGIEQIMQGFYKLNLRPYLERIESSIVRHLMPREDWGKVVIEFDFDSLLRADKSTRLEGQSKAVNSGLLTPNEGRAEEGKAPLKGGGVLYLNSTLVPAGTTINGDRDSEGESDEERVDAEDNSA